MWCHSSNSLRRHQMLGDKGQATHHFAFSISRNSPAVSSAAERRRHGLKTNARLEKTLVEIRPLPYFHAFLRYRFVLRVRFAYCMKTENGGRACCLSGKRQRQDGVTKWLNTKTESGTDESIPAKFAQEVFALSVAVKSSHC